MKKFFGGFGRLLLAMTSVQSVIDPLTKVARNMRLWAAENLRVTNEHWYAIERNKYAPWGCGRLGGRQIKDMRVKPRNREYA